MARCSNGSQALSKSRHNYVTHSTKPLTSPMLPGAHPVAGREWGPCGTGICEGLPVSGVHAHNIQPYNPQNPTTVTQTLTDLPYRLGSK